MSKVYVGDTGTLIRFMFKEPLPTGATAVIEYRKPDGTEGSWPASISPGDATYPYYVEYVIQSGDLDQPGPWRLQVYLSSPTWTGRSNTQRMTVHRRFE